GEFPHSGRPVHPVQPFVEFLVVDAAFRKRVAEHFGAALAVRVRGAETFQVHGGAPHSSRRRQRIHGSFLFPRVRVRTLTELNITLPRRRIVGALTVTAESVFFKSTSPKIGVVSLTIRTPGGTVSFSEPKTSPHWMTTSRWDRTASRKSSAISPNRVDVLVRGSTSQRPLRFAEPNTATMFSAPVLEARSSSASESVGAGPRSAMSGCKSPKVVAVERASSRSACSSAVSLPSTK